MKKIFFIFICILVNVFFIKAQTSASFIAPDTVCLNTTFALQNTTTGGGSSYYWNFCSGNVNTTPQAVNLGNIGNFNGPVFSCITFDAGNYHVFVDNNSSGTLTRLDYGNSLLNIPTSVNLGSLGGVLPGNLEDIHIEKENGNWYAIAVGGYSGSEQILKLSFGNSLTNTPTAVSYGNIGGLSYPQRLQIFNSGGNIYGFVTNRNGNTFTRFDFGNSITNTPTGINFGNIGQLNIPDAISIINFANNWYGFIINEGSNSVTRLDFGSSLLNTPTGTNLGVSSVLNGPRGLNIFTDCNNVSGLITNRFSNDLVVLNFPIGPTGPINFTSVGNLANFSFPHSIERFRVGDTLYAFIPNVSNNTMSRVFWPGCTNASIASSTLQTPPTISYNAVGTYNISLVVDETLITESSYCKEVVVIAPPTATITGNSNFCVSDTIRLYGLAPVGCTFQWNGPNNFSSTNSNISIPPNTGNVSGTYSLVVSKNGCSSPQVVQTISITPSPIVNIGNDTSFCTPSFTMTLNAENPGSNYNWSTGQVSQFITINTAGTYSVLVTNSAGCVASVSITINNAGSIAVNIGNDTLMCQGSMLTLNAGNVGSFYQWNTGATTQTININAAGIYSVYVSNMNGCFGMDTISITSYNPSVNLGNDTNFCTGHPFILDAKNPGSNYTWNTGVNTQTISVNSSGTYSVIVSLGDCFYQDAINVVINPIPIINLGGALSICNTAQLILDAGNLGSAYLWNTGATSQTISVNTAGNFSVTVTNSFSCSATANKTISLYNLVVNLGKDTSICQGNSILLSAGNLGSNYLWSTNATTETIKVYNAGTYWVKVNQGTCFNYDTILVKTDAKPIVYIGKDTVMCPGDNVELSVKPSYTSYYWSNGSTTSNITINNPGTYSVTVSNGVCKASDYIFIDECEGEIWVPNCFTPNDDYINQYFTPVYSNIDNLTIVIFNRWGQEIFKSSDNNIAWDGNYKGKPCEEGVYCYVINYEKSGKYPQKKRLSGIVTLLR